MIAAQAFLPASSRAQSRFGGNIALASQLVDRGLAVTPATPILQGAISWTSPAGWSAGVAAGAEIRSPGTPAIALARVSRAWALSPDWQSQASLLYYDYHGNGVPDRADANVYFTYRDSLSFGLSAIRVEGAGARKGWTTGAADATFSWPLTQRLSVSAGAGVTEATVWKYGRSHAPYGGYGRGYRYYRVQRYGYGSLGLAWSDGSWRLQVDRNMNSLGSQLAYGSRAPGWVATLSRSF